MKRAIAFLLALTLLLAGCNANPTADPTQSTTLPAETAGTSTDPTVDATQPGTAPGAPTDPTEAPTVPTQTPTGPADPTEVPTDPTDAPTTPTDAPKEPTTEETEPPSQTEPPQTPTEPSPSGRPTSSATCKDTGSDKIWENPDAGEPDYYEETDPDRAAYVQYLLANGNPYFFYFEEEYMRMYLGRTYGMPLITGGEMLVHCNWSSSDPSVATVNQMGFVTPLKTGETVINVTYVDPETLEATARECTVTVIEEPQYTYAQLEQRAKEEAQKIADYAMKTGKTDLERIAIAAAFINIYVAEGKGGERYTIVDGELVSYRIPGYNQPFGTLVTFHSTCAGDTRALGLVLEYMGFEWYHAGENQWDHQWCVVYDVDGQTAFADGSFMGIAGYGERLEDRSNWMQYRNNGLVPVP